MGTPAQSERHLFKHVLSTDVHVDERNLKIRARCGLPRTVKAPRQLSARLLLDLSARRLFEQKPNGMLLDEFELGSVLSEAICVRLPVLLEVVLDGARPAELVEVTVRHSVHRGESCLLFT